MSIPNEDEQLRERLARIDPAATLQPASETEILRMVQNTISTPARTSSRKPLFLGLGALAVGAAAAAVVGIVLTAPGGDVTRLSAPSGGGPAAMCAELTPETMAGADLAVAGTVVSINGDDVTLEVTERFTGESADRIVVAQQDPDLPSELSAGSFEQGQDYLISSIDGVITTCGQSGPASPELEQLYRAAF
ncbi:hypothetical protein [Arenivirga flava]|uniref:Uncharacterized protein n=1 Tax=Arenivirga flava TaxID=1930060 RepID=A0AA37UFJ3_9MICO|nr:hypothetical protein [Arenivirga flava]GMA28054.1 hypothetical protein GCM10025874_13070 [Arenivirga flava]